MNRLTGLLVLTAAALSPPPGIGAERIEPKMIELPSVLNGGFNGMLAEAELKNMAAKYRRMHQLPFTAKEWKPEALRRKIWQSMGVAIDHSVPLDLQVTGEITMPGYRIQKLCYQSRPGVYVTGNLYIPDGKGPFPAVVNLHGHWEQGRLAARIQERGHMLAKSGYVCLAVDAFGAGERCPEHGVYVSHGGLLGGAPFQFGETLMGLQLVDNMRGVDLLTSLPFVRKDRIGACGASGGGNQTMWLAAMDERIMAAVPVVSVGTFESYIICRNCICEVLPDGLTFTEEAGVLALAAPRAMMPINGVYDVNPAFNPMQTRASVDEAKRIYRALGAADHVRQLVLEEPHAFSPDGQRAMLGWFNRHLKDEGDGDPVTELPQYATLPEADLMVFERGKRPAGVVSLPEYARIREAELRKQAKFSTEKLKTILRLEPLTLKKVEEFSPRAGWARIGVEASDGRLLPILYRAPQKGSKRVILFGTPYKKIHLQQNQLIQRMLSEGNGVALIDLWGGGENDLRLDPEYRDLYYNRSLMWLGKNLQGKWVEDFQLAERWLKKKLPDATIAAGGWEEGTIAAMMFAALRGGGTDLWMDGAPTSLGYSPKRSSRYGQSFIVPGILTCADVPELLKQASGKIHSVNIIE